MRTSAITVHADQEIFTVKNFSPLGHTEKIKHVNIFLTQKKKAT